MGTGEPRWNSGIPKTKYSSWTWFMRQCFDYHVYWLTVLLRRQNCDSYIQWENQEVIPYIVCGFTHLACWRVSHDRIVSWAPNVNFRKISVRKTIWDLEFSEPNRTISYQNPWVCYFLVQIKAIVLLSLAELANLNNKAKTKWILVVVVKYRHRAIVLLLKKFFLACLS